MSCSVMPSAKYSCSGSPDRSSSGSTAIDRIGWSASSIRRWKRSGKIHVAMPDGRREQQPSTANRHSARRRCARAWRRSIPRPASARPRRRQPSAIARRDPSRDSGARSRRSRRATDAGREETGRWLTLEDGGADIVALSPSNARRPVKHLVQDRAEREQIAAGVDLAACDLLGRHVADRAQNRAAARQVRLVSLAALDACLTRQRRMSTDCAVTSRLGRPQPDLPPSGISRARNRAAWRRPAVSMMLAGLRSRWMMPWRWA